VLDYSLLNYLINGRRLVLVLTLQWTAPNITKHSITNVTVLSHSISSVQKLYCQWNPSSTLQGCY